MPSSKFASFVTKFSIYFWLRYCSCSEPDHEFRPCDLQNGGPQPSGDRLARGKRWPGGLEHHGPDACELWPGRDRTGCWDGHPGRHGHGQTAGRLLQKQRVPALERRLHGRTGARIIHTQTTSSQLNFITHRAKTKAYDKQIEIFVWDIDADTGD